MWLLRVAICDLKRLGAYLFFLKADLLLLGWFCGLLQFADRFKDDEEVPVVLPFELGELPSQVFVVGDEFAKATKARMMAMLT